MELNEKKQELYGRWIRRFRLWEEALEKYHDRLKGYLLPGEVIEGTVINIPDRMFNTEPITEIVKLRANMKRAEIRQNSAWKKFIELK
jgi:hypothetical protein